MQYEIVKRDVVYPRHSVITDQEPVLDADGNQVTTLIPFRDESGEPVIDVEPLLDDAGKAVFYLQTVQNAEGMPLLDDKEQPIINSVPVFKKVPRMQAIPLMRKLWDSIEDTDLAPDGLKFYVIAWDDDSDKQHGTKLEFTIGRAAFEGLDASAKQAIIAREVELSYASAGFAHMPSVSAAKKTQLWMDGI